LSNKSLTFCPEDIILTKNDINSLVKKSEKKFTKNCRDDNELIIIKALYKEQEKLSNDCKVTKMESKHSLARINALKNGVPMTIRPVIKIDKDKLYKKLMVNGIMNKKKNPSSKINITSSSDYNIILYYNSVAHGLLSYFRCADDFFKVKNIVK